MAYEDLYKFLELLYVGKTTISSEKEAQVLLQLSSRCGEDFIMSSCIRVLKDDSFPSTITYPYLALDHMALKPEFCDVVFDLGNYLVPAHKAILFATSTHFRAMFSVGMKEETEESIYMGDEWQVTTFCTFLKMCYSLDCESSFDLKDIYMDAPIDVRELVDLSNFYFENEFTSLIIDYLLRTLDECDWNVSSLNWLWEQTNTPPLTWTLSNWSIIPYGEFLIYGLIDSGNTPRYHGTRDTNTLKNTEPDGKDYLILVGNMMCALCAMDPSRFPENIPVIPNVKIEDIISQDGLLLKYIASNLERLAENTSELLSLSEDIVSRLLLYIATCSIRCERKPWITLWVASIFKVQWAVSAFMFICQNSVSASNASSILLVVEKLGLDINHPLRIAALECLDNNLLSISIEKGSKDLKEITNRNQQYAERFGKKITAGRAMLKNSDRNICASCKNHLVSTNKFRCQICQNVCCVSCQSDGLKLPDSLPFLASKRIVKPCVVCNKVLSSVYTIDRLITSNHVVS
eukprot:TRINITY_DN1240_c0_g1_i4.p1 TRINITY_DN1240_c0_g1~~TRINITY_DN1240_c0_g1_i4.p1  ORF type:complete len:519 (+),score=62.83 TRINITY_DN1240_c0_g1_i4:209-1765(+)